MDQKEVDHIHIFFKDGTSTSMTAEEANGPIIYKRDWISPNGVGHRGEGRYQRHEVHWTEAPIDTPYGSEL